MRFILLTALLMTIATFKSSAEGCACPCNAEGIGTASQSGVSATDKWLLNINRRYYKSTRHFTGFADQKQNIATGVYTRSAAASTIF